MRLSRLALSLVLPLAAAGAATAYTMPDHAPYDGLISIDPGGLPIIPETLHLNAGVGYWSADKNFNDDGDTVSDTTKPAALLVPLDLGYAFNEHYMADITLQILRPSHTLVDAGTGEGTTYNAIGLGDLWIKARGLWETAADFYLGPRLAVKVPVGKVDYEDNKPELGDDQMDIDVALVAGKYGESTIFVMSGQAGFRYRMKKTVTVPGYIPTFEYDYTPGMMIYLHAEPGIAVSGDRAFQVYVPIGYEMSMKDKADAAAGWPGGPRQREALEVDHSSLYAGLYPKYQLDERNAIGLKFMYPVMGTNSPQGMYVTLTYGAFIKM
jgi:hypothetical protein